jgi:hypothetical protein
MILFDVAKTKKRKSSHHLKNDFMADYKMKQYYGLGHILSRQVIS